MTRRCAECGVTLMRGEGGVRAWGRLFCSEDCADAYEQDPLTEADVNDMYPEWSGSLGSTLRGWDL